MIAERRRRAKLAGDRDEARRLNDEFQRAARKDKEKYWNEEGVKAEEAGKRGHTRQLTYQ